MTQHEEATPSSVAGPVDSAVPEVLGVGASGLWQSLPLPRGERDEMAIAAVDADRGLREHLSSILNAETLIVLAGSGTSLGLRQEDGSRQAPSMAALWQDVSVLPEYKAVRGKLNAALLAQQNLEHVLSDAQARQALYLDDVELSAFIAAAEGRVLDRCSFVNDATDVSAHEIFLRKVARRSTRLLRTQLFTTNYDLAFEVAARKARFNVIDGFGYGGLNFDGGSFDLDYVRRRPNEELALEPNVFHLLKLHGSVDWNAEASGIRKSLGLPDRPLLIYPSAAKYQLSYQQPYLEFMSRFQIALRQPDVGLIVVGFGFNDQHINAPIEAALRSNIGMRAVVVTPAARADSRAPSLEWIEHLIQRGDRRLSMYSGDFDDLVQRLPEVPMQEERDAHAARVAPWLAEGAP